MKRILSLVLMISLIGSFSFADDALFTRLSTQYQNVKVERVIKSDLLQLDNGKKVRLIGIKSFDRPRPKEMPERDKYGFVIEEPVDPTTSIEDRASDFAVDLMSQKKVTVEFDTQTSDPDGYTLGYVFLPDGTMANAELLRQGYAHLQIQPPNIKYADKLRDAYREARQEKRGIHAE